MAGTKMAANKMAAKYEMSSFIRLVIGADWIVFLKCVTVHMPSQQDKMVNSEYRHENCSSFIV